MLSVVTFQAPGVPQAMVDKVIAHNQQAKSAGRKPLLSEHHRKKRDPIHGAGEAWTPTGTGAGPKRNFIEAMRVGLGRLLERLDPEARRRGHYVQVWNQARDAMEASGSAEDARRIIEASDVPDRDRQAMLENLDQIELATDR
jgi:hypothetical protein